jgi:hypothetical protein
MRIEKAWRHSEKPGWLVKKRKSKSENRKSGKPNSRDSAETLRTQTGAEKNARKSEVTASPCELQRKRKEKSS